MDLRDKKILISIPCRDTVSVGFVETLLGLMKPCQCCYRFGVSGLVFDARDEAAQIAVNNGYDYVLFIDSDMFFAPDALLQLISHEDADVVTGLYFKRKGNHDPVLYEKIGPRIMNEDGTVKQHGFCEEVKDLDRDYFEVEGCGFGFCLVKTQVFVDMRLNGFVSFFEPIPGMGEDLSFCERCKQIGTKIMCDSTIWLGHGGTYVFDRKDYISDVKQS